MRFVRQDLPIEFFDKLLLIKSRTRLVQCKSLREEIDVFDARRGVHETAVECGFNREQAHYIVTAITELAHNIIDHANDGELMVELEEVFIEQYGVGQWQTLAIRIKAQDVGPGIPDINKAFEDGYSTANSLGCGLSGVRRLMDLVKVTTDTSGSIIEAALYQTNAVREVCSVG
jgi:serine/threonine-protein kinase RsbT